MRAVARQVAALVCLALLPAIAQALYLRNKVSWQTPVAPSEMISVRDAMALGEKAIWLDARLDADFEQEHVPGAIQLNEDRFNELLPQHIQALLGMTIDASLADTVLATGRKTPK